MIVEKIFLLSAAVCLVGLAVAALYCVFTGQLGPDQHIIMIVGQGAPVEGP